MAIPRICTAFALSALVTFSIEAAAQQPAACDYNCLTTSMSGFLEAMTAGKSGSIPLTQHAEIRENTKVVSLAASTWRSPVRCGTAAGPAHESR